MSKEALQIALEALTDFDYDKRMKAIETIKRSLETKDEPVAWMNKHGACKTSLFREEEAGAKEEYTIPVYTQPQRTWVGLKDDDEIPWDGVDAKSFAKAIEAKLKEKNYDIPN